MILILVLDLAVILSLIVAASHDGVEGALPTAAFFLLLLPAEAQLQIPGLFGLTTQRLVVAMLCILYVTAKRPGDGHAQNKGVPLGYLLILLAAWMVLATAKSVVPLISIKALLSQCFDFSILYVLCVLNISRRETVQRILFALVAAMTVCSLLGVLELRTGWQMSSLFPSMPGRFADLSAVDDRGVRIQSTFPNPILFGAALVMTISIAFYLLTLKNTKTRKVLLWLAVGLMIYCLYKTGSRGPWLAFALSLGLLGLLGRKPVRKLVAVIMLLAPTILIFRPAVWQTTSNLYHATAGNDDSPQQESYQWRYELFHLAQNELSKDMGHSLWGFGPESFYYLGLKTTAMVDGEEKTVVAESCDSAVVELMMDTGYVGFLLVAIMLLRAMYVSLRAYFSSPRESDEFHLIMFVCLAAFSFLMTNVELFGWGQQSYMLWLLLALAMSFPKPVAELETSSARIAATAMPESA